MATLAIRGHATRGKEVFEILEMLGGENPYAISKTVEGVLYKISNYDNRIVACHPTDTFVVFTLEEFLEKFPYKVGDKVLYKTYGIYSKIKSMCWNKEKEQVFYRLDSKNFFVATVDELKPYKQIKETMKEKIQTINLESEEFADKVGVMMGNYEVEVIDGITFFIKKQPQYPKTYEECCKVLGIDIQFCMKYLPHGTFSYRDTLIYNLQELIICRDAYWKIAGEQMGLGKSWKQDYDNRGFIIANNNGNIHTYEYHGNNNIILAFPTKEMCDIFYKNFKDLIEQCKELL